MLTHAISETNMSPKKKKITNNGNLASEVQCSFQELSGNSVPCYKTDRGDWMVPVTLLRKTRFSNTNLPELKAIIQDATGCIERMSNVEIRKMKCWLKRRYGRIIFTDSEMSCSLKSIKENYSKLLKAIVRSKPSKLQGIVCRKHLGYDKKLVESERGWKKMSSDVVRIGKHQSTFDEFCVNGATESVASVKSSFEIETSPPCSNTDTHDVVKMPINASPLVYPFKGTRSRVNKNYKKVEDVQSMESNAVNEGISSPLDSSSARAIIKNNLATNDMREKSPKYFSVNSSKSEISPVDSAATKHKRILLAFSQNIETNASKQLNNFRSGNFQPTGEISNTLNRQVRSSNQIQINLPSHKANDLKNKKEDHIIKVSTKCSSNSTMNCLNSHNETNVASEAPHYLSKHDDVNASNNMPPDIIATSGDLPVVNSPVIAEDVKLSNVKMSDIAENKNSATACTSHSFAFDAGLLPDTLATDECTSLCFDQLFNEFPQEVLLEDSNGNIKGNEAKHDSTFKHKVSNQPLSYTTSNLIDDHRNRQFLLRSLPNQYSQRDFERTVNYKVASEVVPDLPQLENAFPPRFLLTDKQSDDYWKNDVVNKEFENSVPIPPLHPHRPSFSKHDLLTEPELTRTDFFLGLASPAWKRSSAYSKNNYPQFHNFRNGIDVHNRRMSYESRAMHHSVTLPNTFQPYKRPTFHRPERITRPQHHNSQYKSNKKWGRFHGLNNYRTKSSWSKHSPSADSQDVSSSPIEIQEKALMESKGEPKLAGHKEFVKRIKNNFSDKTTNENQQKLLNKTEENPLKHEVTKLIKSVRKAPHSVNIFPDTSVKLDNSKVTSATTNVSISPIGTKTKISLKTKKDKSAGAAVMKKRIERFSKPNTVIIPKKRPVSSNKTKSVSKNVSVVNGNITSAKSNVGDTKSRKLVNSKQLLDEELPSHPSHRVKSDETANVRKYFPDEEDTLKQEHSLEWPFAISLESDAFMDFHITCGGCSIKPSDERVNQQASKGLLLADTSNVGNIENSSVVELLSSGLKTRLNERAISLVRLSKNEINVVSKETSYPKKWKTIILEKSKQESNAIPTLSSRVDDGLITKEGSELNSSNISTNSLIVHREKAESTICAESSTDMVGVVFTDSHLELDCKNNNGKAEEYVEQIALFHNQSLNSIEQSSEVMCAQKKILQTNIDNLADHGECDSNSGMIGNETAPSNASNTTAEQTHNVVASEKSVGKLNSISKTLSSKSMAGDKVSSEDILTQIHARTCKVHIIPCDAEKSMANTAEHVDTSKTTVQEQTITPPRPRKARKTIYCSKKSQALSNSKSNMKNMKVRNISDNTDECHTRANVEKSVSNTITNVTAIHVDREDASTLNLPAATSDEVSTAAVPETIPISLRLRSGRRIQPVASVVASNTNLRKNQPQSTDLCHEVKDPLREVHTMSSQKEDSVDEDLRKISSCSKESKNSRKQFDDTNKLDGDEYNDMTRKMEQDFPMQIIDSDKIKGEPSAANKTCCNTAQTSFLCCEEDPNKSLIKPCVLSHIANDDVSATGISNQPDVFPLAASKECSTSVVKDITNLSTRKLKIIKCDADKLDISDKLQEETQNESNNNNIAIKAKVANNKLDSCNLQDVSKDSVLTSLPCSSSDSLPPVVVTDVVKGSVHECDLNQPKEGVTSKYSVKLNKVSSKTIKQFVSVSNNVESTEAKSKQHVNHSVVNCAEISSASTHTVLNNETKLTFTFPLPTISATCIRPLGTTTTAISHSNSTSVATNNLSHNNSMLMPAEILYKETCSHGLIEVELFAPAHFLVNITTKSSKVMFIRRRIPYIQVKYTPQFTGNTSGICFDPAPNFNGDVTIQGGAALGSETSTLTQPTIEINLVRIRDIAFILNLRPADLLKDVQESLIKCVTPNTFMKLVYDTIYNPLSEIYAPLSFLLGLKSDTSTKLVNEDSLINLQDVLRIVIPAYYEKSFNIPSKQLPDYVFVKTFQTTSEVTPQIRKLFSESFFYNILLVRDDILIKQKGIEVNVPKPATKRKNTRKRSLSATSAGSVKWGSASNLNPSTMLGITSSMKSSTNLPTIHTRSPMVVYDDFEFLQPAKVLPQTPCTLSQPNPNTVISPGKDATFTDFEYGPSNLQNTPYISLRHPSMFKQNTPCMTTYVATTSCVESSNSCYSPSVVPVAQRQTNPWLMTNSASNPATSSTSRLHAKAPAARRAVVSKKVPSKFKIATKFVVSSSSVNSPGCHVSSRLSTSSMHTNDFSKVKETKNELGDASNHLKKIRWILPSQTKRDVSSLENETKSEISNLDTSSKTSDAIDDDELGLRVNAVYSLSKQAEEPTTSEFFDGVLSKSADNYADDVESEPNSLAAGIRNLKRTIESPGYVTPNEGDVSLNDVSTMNTRRLKLRKVGSGVSKGQGSPLKNTLGKLKKRVNSKQKTVFLWKDC